MAKKKAAAVTKRIDVKDIEVDGTYKTYVKDIVKILKINEDRKQIILYNISGSHKQWVDFRNIYLVERLR